MNFKSMTKQISNALPSGRSKKQNVPPNLKKNVKRQKTSGWTTFRIWRTKMNSKAGGNIAGCWSKAATAMCRKTSSSNQALALIFLWKKHRMNVWWQYSTTGISSSTCKRTKTYTKWTGIYKTKRPGTE